DLAIDLSERVGRQFLQLRRLHGGENREHADQPGDVETQHGAEPNSGSGLWPRWPGCAIMEVWRSPSMRESISVMCTSRWRIWNVPSRFIRGCWDSRSPSDGAHLRPSSVRAAITTTSD